MWTKRHTDGACGSKCIEKCFNYEYLKVNVEKKHTFQCNVSTKESFYSKYAARQKSRVHLRKLKSEKSKKYISCYLLRLMHISGTRAYFFVFCVGGPSMCWHAARRRWRGITSLEYERWWDIEGPQPENVRECMKKMTTNTNFQKTWRRTRHITSWELATLYDMSLLNLGHQVGCIWILQCSVWLNISGQE